LTAVSALAFGLNKMVEARRQVTASRDHDSAAGERLRSLGLVIDIDRMAEALIAITLDGLAARRQDAPSDRKQAQKKRR
jgi:hypothetical protein